MDRPPPPQRPSDAPLSFRRRATTSSIPEKPQPSPTLSTSDSSNLALPSIRLLHPHLPPPTPLFASADPSSHFTSHTGFEQPPVASGSGGTGMTLQQSPELPSIPEASDSEKEVAAPPKKRRKRQALSCTECKRRKIKCDRNQPCGPCAHRNEAHKCQWHQVETNDKYVTRAEFDQLKAKVDHLETIITRLTQSGNLPSMQQVMGVNLPFSSSSPSLPIPGFAHPPRPPSVSSGMYPPTSEIHVDSYAPLRQISLRPSSRAQPSGEAMSPQLDRDATMPRIQPPASTPHAVRQLPPSLAAITTPFDHVPDDRSKKCSAQTLIWQGGRLRQSCRATYDPVPIPHSPISPILQARRCPPLSFVTLLLLQFVVVHLAIHLPLLSFLNVLENLVVIFFHLQVRVANDIMVRTSRRVQVVGRRSPLLKKLSSGDVPFGVLKFMLDLTLIQQRCRTLSNIADYRSLY